MDLLKTVLKKTQNTLEDRLNCSTTSEMSLCGYESALDQSNSLYFSMSENDGDKTTTFDESLASESTLKCTDDSIATTTNSPSITLISSTPMKSSNITFETVMEEEAFTEGSPCLNVPVINIDTSDTDNNIAVNPFTCGESQEIKSLDEVSAGLNVPVIIVNTSNDDISIAVNPFTCGESQEIKSLDEVSAGLNVPVIIVNTSNDDNSIAVNPFTCGESQEKENVAGVSPFLKVPTIMFKTNDNDNNIAVNTITCEETQKLKTIMKKPTTCISKIVTRSHLYNPIQRKSLDKLTPMFANRRSVAMTKPIQKITKTKVSFSCEWCKKSFDINKALTNHLIEYCQKIPCNERKKLTNPVASITDQKRKSIFIMPAARQTSASTIKRPKMNSGITITPKKTLSCSLCTLKFQDVCSYATHIITHKKS